MVEGLLMAHSGWRYLVILVGAVAVAKLLYGRIGGGTWSKADATLLLVTTIVVDIQVLLGMLLWTLEQRWTGVYPLASWEHPVTMLAVLVLAHVGAGRAKGAPTGEKYRQATVWLVPAGVLLAIGVARITL